MVRRHQRSDVKSRAIAAAGKQWKSELIAGGIVVTRQENNHRPFLPSFAAAVKSPLNDIVYREIARPGCGKMEIERSVEFNLCRLTFSGNKIQPIQELKRFLQPRVFCIGA